MTSTYTNEQWEGILTRAGEIGAEHGKAAATWIEISDADAAAELIEMLDAGDPAVYDAMPRTPNGEYADDYSPAQLLADLGLPDDAETDDGSIWDAYVTEFESAAVDAVETKARRMVRDAGIETVRGYSVYTLANTADTSYHPDNDDSAGAKFLDHVRLSVLDYFEEESFDPSEYNDVVHEIADAAPDVYTSTRWAEFTDLGAYHEDITEYGEVDGSDITRSVAGVALYMIAERLAAALFAELTGGDA